MLTYMTHSLQVSRDGSATPTRLMTQPVTYYAEARSHYYRR